MQPQHSDFDEYGKRLFRRNEHKEESFKIASPCSSANAQRTILERTLRDGAACETSTVELLAQVSKAAKKKYRKARLGTKAAKQYERLENVGDELDGDAAAIFRALSARFLYLAQNVHLQRKSYAASSQLLQRRTRSLKRCCKVSCWHAEAGLRIPRSTT